MGAAALTVILVSTGYAGSDLYNLRLARRQERLARVNRQLAALHGAFLALTEADSRLFAASTERHPRADGRSPRRCARERFDALKRGRTRLL
ncbi:hypothetical protein [Streptomyces sulphureus]|uniref:hypothetical protein n=1 Tax=Streptomyces sulphureus TaxID=47758 RepID=UPI00036FA769|nr:hypothetical protein [Streptomyces sulphureus]